MSDDKVLFERFTPVQSGTDIRDGVAEAARLATRGKAEEAASILAEVTESRIGAEAVAWMIAKTLVKAYEITSEEEILIDGPEDDISLALKYVLANAAIHTNDDDAIPVVREIGTWSDQLVVDVLGSLFRMVVDMNIGYIAHNQ